MDAISFVVGMQSRDLRGKKMEDLIFRRGADDNEGTRARARPRGSA